MIITYIRNRLPNNSMPKYYDMGHQAICSFFLFMFSVIAAPSACVPILHAFVAILVVALA